MKPLASIALTYFTFKVRDFILDLDGLNDSPRATEPLLLCVFGVRVQILVRTMLRKRSFGNPFDWGRREERGNLSAPGQTLT